MGNRGRPREGPINRTVASFWVAHLVRVTGVTDGRSFAREILERPAWADAFARYEKAANAPQWLSDDPSAAAALALAESKVPGSIHYIASPMWRLIQSRDVSAEQLAEWNSRITREKAYLARLTDSPDNLRNPYREVELTFHHLEAMIALLHEARSSSNDADEAKFVSLFASLRPAFAKAQFLAGFENSLLLPAADWVGEPSELSVVEMKNGNPPAPRRPILAAVTIVLAAMVGLVDYDSPGQLTLTAIVLVGCLAVLCTQPSHERRPAQLTPMTLAGSVWRRRYKMR